MSRPSYHIRNLTQYDIVLDKHDSSTLLCSFSGTSHPERRSLAVRLPRLKRLAAIAGGVKWREVEWTLDGDRVKAGWWRGRQRASRMRGKPSSTIDEKTCLLQKEDTDVVSGRPFDPRPAMKAYYRQDSNCAATVLFLPQLALDSHLSDLSDETSLGDLVLPGTHESLALRGWPVSQCQEPDCFLNVQLQEGIRFFDIRLSVKKGILLAYHGPWPQLVPFTTMLAQLSEFLRLHRRETLIICIQQEHPSSSLLFSSLVRQAMDEGIRRGEWWLENRVPLLGEVRGRGILMSRFGGSERDGGAIPWLFDEAGESEPPEEEDYGVGESHYYEGETFSSTARPRKKKPKGVVRMGWTPETWPNSALDGFTWHCSETPCRTQDWYEIYGFFNIPAKFNTLMGHLTTSSQFPPSSILTISFASAGSIPLALPTFVANGFGWPRWGLGLYGVNQRLKDWLLDCLNASGENEDVGMLRGIVPMDFYRKAGLVDIMVAFNSRQNSARCS